MTKAIESVADARQRQQIREAMARLVAGTSVHSDGKLTIKSLAEEAQVKRWILTHRHTDLQAEFRAQIAHGTDGPPTAIKKLQDAHAKAADTIDKLRVEVADLKATVRQFERVVQVLALENHELKNPTTASPGSPALSVVSPDGNPKAAADAPHYRKPCS